MTEAENLMAETRLWKLPRLMGMWKIEIRKGVILL